MRSLQILYVFVLRAEVLTTFSSKVVIFSARNTKTYKIYKLRKLFLILQHFSTKLCNFTNYKMFFLAVVVDFVRLA